MAHSGTHRRNDIKITRVGNLIKGNGKLYMRVKLPRLDKNFALTLTSKTLDGKELPAKILNSSKGSIVVLPDIGKEQRITWKLSKKTAHRANDAVNEEYLTTELSHASELEESAKHTCKDLRTLQYANSHRSTSRIVQEELVKKRAFSMSISPKSMMKSRHSLSIRNLDHPPVIGDTRIHVQDVIDDKGVDIIHGEIHIPISDTAHAHDYIDLRVINTNGDSVQLCDWVCLDDSVIEFDEISGNNVRKVAFSVRIPRDGDIFIWAHMPQGNSSDGFIFFEEDERSAQRNGRLRATLNAAGDPDYDMWFRKRHKAARWQLEMQLNAHFEKNPRFSIVVPLFRTPIEFLNDMANSVMWQTYGNWELILVNASREDGMLFKAVEDLCHKDKRIRTITLPKNLGITLNTNEGIKIAKGDFICFLDHDDFLEPDALYCYARAINEHPHTDMLYCDEDKFDNGIYREPFFKPDWSPELLNSMNYVCHFLTVRKSIVDTLSLPEEEYDGSQDWHMTFRVGEKARYVHHEPRVLYHWRVHANSTAYRVDQKAYTVDSSVLSIESHLERCGVKGEVVKSIQSPIRYCIDYDLSDEPLVSIIIPNKDALPVLHRCLSSLKKYTTYKNYEIIIVENNSTDPYLFDYYRRIQQDEKNIKVITVHGMKEFNFSRLINEGVRASHGDYVLLLNNDTEIITPQWLEYMLGETRWDGVGIVGAKLLLPDNTIQHAGVMLSPQGPGHLYVNMPSTFSGNVEEVLVNTNVPAVTGACLLLSRKLYDEVGGLDEDLAVNYNDIDLCLRVLEKDKRVVFCARAELYHYESVSRGSTSAIKGEKLTRFDRERGMYIARWSQTVNPYTAPYTNPNFYFGSAYKILNRDFEPETW